jgi:hypothetical protein
MPRGRPRLTEEEKAYRALSRAMAPKRPRAPRVKKTAEEKTAAALAKAERAAARTAMREYNAGLRRKPSKNFIGARLPAFVGPRLPQAPRRAYVKKTPEQKFEEAMRKQERAQIRAYKNMVNPKPAPKPRSYAAALRPRAVPYTSKNFIGALSQPQIQKMVLRAEKKQIAALRDLAAAVPLPPDVKPRRVKALKQYPAAPSYR